MSGRHLSYEIPYIRILASQGTLAPCCCVQRFFFNGFTTANERFNSAVVGPSHRFSPLPRHFIFAQIQQNHNHGTGISMQLGNDGELFC